MKKILWFLFGFALAGGLAAVLRNSWQTASYFKEHGREASLTIGQKYNASRWMEPIPIKKVHSYVAILAPDHELVIESDQQLKEKDEYFVRFLLRDSADAARELSFRPLVGTMRLKSEADGKPVRLADTNIFDRAVDVAMGPPAEGVYVRPRETAEAAPDHQKPTVPFVFAGANDSAFEIMIHNSSVGEWIIAGLWLIAIKMVILHAWVTPFDPNRKTGVERKGWVHPSMRGGADGEPKPVEASKKIAYTPKPQDHDYINPTPPAPPPAAPTAPPTPRTVSLPATAADPSAPPSVPTEPYSTATTAPFVPVGGSTEPSLKLSRKPRGGSTNPPATPPANPPADGA